MNSEAKGKMKGVFGVGEKESMKFKRGEKVLGVSESGVERKCGDDRVRNGEGVDKWLGKKEGMEKSYVKRGVVG